jgi:hypothetical protein
VDGGYSEIAGSFSAVQNALYRGSNPSRKGCYGAPLKRSIVNEANHMNIQEFAENHSVRIKRDSCGESIIPGKRFLPSRLHLDPDRVEYRAHVYENGEGQFGVCLLFETPKKYGNTRRKFEAAGFQLRQNGETEGTLLFDPANESQARLALQLCGVKKIRQASEAQLQVLAKARAKKAA